MKFRCNKASRCSCANCSSSSAAWRESASWLRISAMALLRNTTVAARDFQRAAKVSLNLAQQQMQTGNANILLLFTTQQTYLQATLQVVQARAARLSGTAALFQALGGGWWNREDRPEQRILNVGTGEADIAAERPGEVRSIGSASSGIFRSDTSP
jgi:hypothetical protein